MEVMRITWGRVRPNSWDEFEAAWRQAIDLAATVDGLLGRSLGRDLNDPDAGYAISLWSSEDAMKSHKATSFSGELNALLEPFYVGSYDVKVCDLRYWDLLGELPAGGARGSSN